uniref:Uncharacterized protein n=1 Tax=Romanomermis culicivorax TaxID=13658 RepID=A0A915K0U3_ROMCU
MDVKLKDRMAANMGLIRQVRTNAKKFIIFSSSEMDHSASSKSYARKCWRFARKIQWTNLDCLERPLSRFFEHYGRLVSRHPWPFILFPILVSCGLSIGFLHKNELTDATYLYTPSGSASKFERQSIHEKWPMVNGNYIPGKSVTSLRECQSIVSARDGGNVLRSEIALAINRLNLFIIDRIKIIYNNKTYSYRDLCLLTNDNTCSTNPQVSLAGTFYSNPAPDLFNFTFPMAKFGTQPVYLGSSLGGVEVNSTTKKVQLAKAWLLLYQLQFTPDNYSYLSVVLTTTCFIVLICLFVMVFVDFTTFAGIFFFFSVFVTLVFFVVVFFIFFGDVFPVLLCIVLVVFILFGFVILICIVFVGFGALVNGFVIFDIMVRSTGALVMAFTSIISSGLVEDSSMCTVDDVSG